MGSIKIRNAELQDVKEILSVEKEAWPEGMQATEEMMESRIRVFPEGTKVALSESNYERIVGVVCVEIVNFDTKNPYPTWQEATDHGTIKHTHNSQGDTVYGVDLSVLPKAPKETGKKLLESVAKMAIARNLRQCVLGGRIPRFARYVEKKLARDPENISKKEMDQIAWKYIHQQSHSRSLDPEVNFYKKVGLEVVDILPNYMEDPRSLNYGVLLRWKNPFFNKPFSRFWSWLFRAK